MGHRRFFKTIRRNYSGDSRHSKNRGTERTKRRQILRVRCLKHFFTNKKRTRPCRNILKSSPLFFHPLTGETLFRGVAYTMVTRVFTGHVSPVCFAYFEAEHLTDEKHFCARDRVVQWTRAYAVPAFRSVRHEKRRNIDAALITLSRKHFTWHFITMA